MCISDFFYIWKTNRMTMFCNLFIERPSYFLLHVHTRLPQPLNPHTCVSVFNLLTVAYSQFLCCHSCSCPVSSSLKIGDRLFRYAPPYLWNKLPISLCQLCTNQSFSLSSPLPSPLIINFSKHIDSVVSTCNQRLYLLRQLAKQGPGIYEHLYSPLLVDNQETNKQENK